MSDLGKWVGFRTFQTPIDIYYQNNHLYFELFFSKHWNVFEFQQRILQISPVWCLHKSSVLLSFRSLHERLYFYEPLSAKYGMEQFSETLCVNWIWWLPQNVNVEMNSSMRAFIRSVLRQIKENQLKRKTKFNNYYEYIEITD